jgi:DNA-binding XRE family transcriptional regulator
MRAERAVTQEAAASEIGVVRDALARWEVGSANPDIRTMPAVIRFLGYDPQPEPDSFPETLVRARRALGLSQPELAQALGVLPGTLRSWEQEKYLPPADHMAAICERVRGLISGADQMSAASA